jgi:signal transduction histidine kinase/CheY-like chemotaxis protein
MTVALQPDEIEQRRRERARSLALRDIPLMRVIGSLFLTMGVYLNNAVLSRPDVVLRPWWYVALALAVYAVISWAAVRVVLFRFRRDLTLMFLFGDIILWSFAIYATGAEKSWLFFIPVLRVADQMQTTVRRCLAFTLWGVACFATMLAYVQVVDGRAVRPAVFVTELIFIGVSGFYISMSARTSESRRAQMATAIRISRDLIRQLEEQSHALREAREHAEAASAAKSEFLANMSHEMRTPLHGVIGMLELAADGESSPQRLRQLEMARRSAEALLGTIDDILDFSKIEARKLDLEPVYFSMREMMQETMKPLGVTAAGKGLALAYIVQNDVPDTLWGDPIRLRQVVINLVGNSIKFTPVGEIAVRVTSEKRDDDTSVAIRFEVRDTGIGIDASQQSRIFQPFVQADSSPSRRYGGTGLGLSIVTRLVEVMGGSIAVESAPGAGSAFTFTIVAECDPFAAPQRKPWESELAGKSMLIVDPNERSRAFIAEMLRSRGIFAMSCASFDEAPQGRFACAIAVEVHDGFEPLILISSPLDAARNDRMRITRPVAERELIEACGVVLGLTTPAPARLPLRGGLAASRLHVLIVEDNIVSQEFAAEALRRLGHEVTIAGDGARALALLQSSRFDIVFMDVQLPGIDGLEVTRRFRAIERESGSHTPLYAITAHTAREERNQCMAAGMDGVLTKPIDRAELARVVRSAPAPRDPIVNAVDGNMRLLARVSAAFSAQTPALVAAMRDAITKHDADALYRNAHKLKGSVANFPTPAVDVAIEIENFAQAGEVDRAAALMPRLEETLRELGQQLSQSTLS